MIATCSTDRKRDSMFPAVLFIAVALFHPSQAEKDLRVQVANQAAQLTEQSHVISGLQAQLATSHIQTATANGDATGSRDALQSRREADSDLLQKGNDAAARGLRTQEQNHDEVIGAMKLQAASIALLSSGVAMMRRLELILTVAVVLDILIITVLLQFVVFIVRWKRL